jgi:hypothetical protein
MYRPSAFSPTFDCTVDFLTNNPIEINSSIGIDVLPLEGGYVLFESAYGGNCVFEYTSATAEGTTITLHCTASSWAESNYYTDPTSPFSPINSAYGTISRTITSADWNDVVDHVLNKNNPHDVSKSQVGLGNVDNTSDLDKPISTVTQQALNGKTDLSLFEQVSSFIGYTPQTLIVSNPTQTAINAVQSNLDDHIADKQNPHAVTKEQVGLGNVDNTSDMGKPISNATQQALNGKLNNSGFTGNAVIITNSQGGAEATPQASGFNKPFSDTMPLSPSISGDEGTDAYISRSDHQHPSETFTISGISVLVGDWVYDGTHPSYPFKANISNASVTENHTPIVVFSQECASLGIYAQVAETSSGMISIYSSEIPNDTTAVRTIVLIKEI